MLDTGCWILDTGYWEGSKVKINTETLKQDDLLGLQRGWE